MRKPTNKTERKIARQQRDRRKSPRGKQWQA